MTYCSICGKHHRPDVGCSDGAGQVLHDMGIKRSRKMSEDEFYEISKKCDKSMLVGWLAFFVGMVLVMGLIAIIRHWGILSSW